MTGSAQYVCCICGIPIQLETSKTDEHGQAVHQECYVCKIISKSRTASAIRLAENWISSIRSERSQLRLRVTDKLLKHRHTAH